MKNQQKALFIIGGILLTGGLVFLGVYLLKKKKQQGTDTSLPPASSTPPQTQPYTPAAPVAPVAGDEFPLKLGSRGPKVGQAQMALKKAGFDPRGIDSDFGGNTRNAVIAWQQSRGFAATGQLSATEFFLLTGSGATPAVPDYNSLGDKLYAAYSAGLASQVVSLLKQLPDTEAYKATSARFQEQTDGWFSARKTLVNGLFEKFGSTAYWKDMQAQFFRMGLVYDAPSGKWGFGGFGHLMESFNGLF